jgi:predicted RNase H-like HicB family nuclease
MTDRYHINLFWSNDDECWISDVPDLKGCSAHGDSAAAAAAEAEIAIQLWLEVAAEHGDPIPEPRYRPAIYAGKQAEAA